MKTATRTTTSLLLLLLLAIPGVQAQQADYASLLKRAESLYADGSYRLAHELYEKAAALALRPEQQRWVRFRTADTLWRAQAGTRTADTTVYENATRDLEALVRDVKDAEDRDRIWAEVHESLADMLWTRRDSRNWSAAWPHYEKALDWWAGAHDIEVARERYLKIVWTIAKPPEAVEYYYYGYYGNSVPLEVLDNVLKIARTAQDRARAHYLGAMTVRHRGGDWHLRRRVPAEFEAALAAGKSTDWYDDALFHYAEWMASTGRVSRLGSGQWSQKPDYVEAVKLYRRLVREFGKGETRYYDQAKEKIKNITKPAVALNVSNAFLPDSEIQFYLTWRNVKRVDFALYRVELTRDVELAGDVGSSQWMSTIVLPPREPVKSWSKKTDDKGDHRPAQEHMRLDGKLPAGAYIVEAAAGGETARDLMLVTDSALVLKASGKKSLIYFGSSLDGAPIGQAEVTLWERNYDGKKWVWARHSGTTNGDGLAAFTLKARENRVELFAAARSADRQAFSLGGAYRYSSQKDPWKIYAFTDRPAYRPGEKVQWKFLARRYDGAVYSTPANQMIEFEIKDPRGTKVAEGKQTLNAFGSTWGSLELTETMPLGEYQVRFWDKGRGHHIGNATLFRLEEYKLPEFKVTVQTPEEEGQRKAFRLGDKVEVTVKAEYYFGGPVADASVEVLVYQNRFFHWWKRPREFPWFYEDMEPRHWSHWGGRGQVVKRETLKTDATGTAKLTFDTPTNSQQDLEYRIEARVTDASRREIIGDGRIRVTRQGYYVYLRPAHHLYRPQDRVSIETKALDANEQPKQVEGTVKVTRDYWFEIWADPSGKEVKGEELKSLRERSPVFPPPPPDPGGRPWRLKFRGYQHDEILTRTLKTDAEGEAALTFTPEREGYYRVAWESKEKDGAPISAETTVWVATNATTELGYRHGGLEIIVDRDTFRAGEKAPVMLVVPTNDRYVLFSVEGDDLYSYRLVHVTGTVKLLQLPIGEQHVPNIFLAGAMVSDHQMFVDTKQVVVPPVEQFLDVKVEYGHDQYQPQEEGTLTVTTLDHGGRPVAAELALGLVDESVFYIQKEYAKDPRQFYYGDKRQQRVETQSTFQRKSYTKLVETDGDKLMDERVLKAREKQKLERLGSVSQEESTEYYAFGGRKFANQQRALAPESRARGYSGLDEMVAMGGAFSDRNDLAAERGLVHAKSALSFEEENRSEPEAAVQVRSDFRSTIFWQPDLVTGEDGKAIVKVKFADSLTRWRATARIATADNRFGMGAAATRTTKPLIVRLQAPRFFVVGDTETISAVINNNTDEPMVVTPSLDAEGLVVSGIMRNGRPERDNHTRVTVEANGEKRVDWAVAARKAGNVKLKVAALNGKFTDAMEKHYIVHEHGIEKLVARSGKVRGGDLTVTLEIPKERKEGSTAMVVQVTPSLAVTMLDALPYLIDYPYGCTEQTMSRYLPTAITVRTLKELGLEPDVVAERVFGGIVREHAEKTHPKGKKSLRDIDKMVQKSQARLYDFQHEDGGWGWWKKGESDHFMTAYVVWGLTLARDAGIDVRKDVLDRGVHYLEKEIIEEELNLDIQAWMLHALSSHHASVRRSEVGRFEAKAFENLWAGRNGLNAYTRALLALSAHHFGYADRAQILVQNLENGVEIDEATSVSTVQRGPTRSHEGAVATAHWGEDGIYWRWSDGGVEATAFGLRALLAIDPQNELVEPVTNWLIKNRRGAQWSNTRDTAITVLTLNEYLQASGELASDVEYELFVNGRSIARREVAAEDVLSAPSRYPIDGKIIRDAANEIRIVRRGGSGPIYFAAQATFFSLEEPVVPAGNEIFVRRQYYKLVGRPTLLKGYVYDRQPLDDRETVRSGERVEVVMTIEAKNNYEYLVFEDLKPAGLEAVRIRSGESLYARELKSGALSRRYGKGTVREDPELYGPPEAPASSVMERVLIPKPDNGEGNDYTGRQRWVYQELRDRKVALFIDKLPEGVWEIRYDLRAEVPGTFHALPVVGHAMYVPEIRCNGAEVRIKVLDKE